MPGDVDRRVVPWLLSVPLMLGGTEVAHWLAFRLVYPDPWARAEVLKQSGHGYLSLLPTLGGVGLALVVCGALLHGRSARPQINVAVGAVETRLWQFATLPLLAFALQEHLEALFTQGTVVGVPLEPTFMLGLSLQLPFAAVAYLVARLLLRTAERVGRAQRRRNCWPCRRAAVPFVVCTRIVAAACSRVGWRPRRAWPSALAPDQSNAVPCHA